MSRPTAKVQIATIAKGKLAGQAYIVRKVRADGKVEVWGGVVKVTQRRIVCDAPRTFKSSFVTLTDADLDDPATVHALTPAKVREQDPEIHARFRACYQAYLAGDDNAFLFGPE